MIKVGILGVTGYTGAELVRLLLNHPDIEINYITTTKHAGEMLNKHYPNLSGFFGVLEYFNKEKATSCDVIFSALPHTESIKYVSQIAEKIPVIDLSEDIRLKDPVLYEQYYGEKHLKSELLEKAVYGLPEIYRDKIKNSKLIANPGCYATAAILALHPLVKEGQIKGSPIIDAKSGISGAGKSPGDKNLFGNINENIIPYSIGNHKHIPEIEQCLAEVNAGKSIKINFTPYLIPVDRGILCTVYADLEGYGWSSKKVYELYSTFYENEPFVNVLDSGSYPNIKSVRGSNRCDIGVYYDENTNKAIIFSAIDNLVKGAAGQAIQNMNIMFGFEETLGLPIEGVFP